MNSETFKKMVLPHGKKLYHFALLLLKDEHAAQDAIQEVYLKLWKIRDDLEKINNIEAFALKITKNWCLDKLKAKKAILIENYANGFDYLKENDEPHNLMERDEKIKLLYDIMETLPEQQRILIKLREIDGYDFDEIAEITELNEVTIRVNLSRARKKIREELIKPDNHGFKKS